MMSLLASSISAVLVFLMYREAKRTSRRNIRKHYKAILLDERAFSLRVERELLQETGAPKEDWESLLEKYGIDKDDPFA